jgi:RNA polymerase sigma-70 factor (ECF subfamily)
MAREVKRAGRGATDPGGGLRVLPRPDAREAFSAFFSSEYPRMVRTVYLVVHDHGHAEEIAQDAFEQLLDHWETVSHYEQPGAWVRRVAIRMAVRASKRERLRSQLERRSRAGVDEVTWLVGTSDEVLAAVRTLPPNQRAAIVLHYFEDRPVAEIADALGCAPATARVHLHKARHRLAELLHEEVDDVVG